MAAARFLAIFVLFVALHGATSANAMLHQLAMQHQCPCIIDASGHSAQI
jgi:hypothetical protein